jgi:internalin A
VLAGNEDIISLDFLAGTPQIETLVLSNLELLPDISPIGALANLRVLDLSFDPTLEDISVLANVSSLRRLDLSGDTALADLSPIAALSNLETLILNDCAEIRSVAFLENLKCLRRLFALRLPHLSDLRSLASTALEQLYVGGREVSDGAPLGKISSLVELMLVEVPRLHNLTFLNDLQKLRSIGIVACQAPLPALAVPTIEDLLIGDCPNVRDLNGLVGLQSLRNLSLRGLPVTDLTPLTQLPRLESLSISNCDPGLDVSMLPSSCRIIH